MSDRVSIRMMTADDCEIISKAFAAQSWNKPLAQYQKYLSEQSEGSRQILIAEMNGEFAGYLTVVRQSDFAPFRKKNIPEIVDFNVLIKFRRKGIGTKLMEAAENLIAEKHETVGIRVGLTADYGAAQALYVKRGYIPDRLGISQNGNYPVYGDKIIVTDALNLSLTKKLKS